MKKFKKRIGILIIVILIITAICGITIYFLTQKDEKETADIYRKIDEEQEERERTGDYEVEEVGNLPEYLSVENCIQKNKDENFKVQEIKFIEKEKSVNYAVYGYIGEEEKYYMLVFDIENETFEIEEMKNVKNIDDIDIKNKTIEEIKNTGNNEFEFLDMSEEDIARKYLEILTKLEIEQPEKAYEMLDSEYKKERFSDLDDYKQYVEENKDIIEEGVLSKYSVDYKDDYTEYIMVDTNANSYTLRAKSAMNFTLLLDNYTIKVEGYETSYSKLSDEEKVKSNVYIFLEMINNKDYKHAYELLDKTFRENNFETLDKFKNHVKENFFSHNIDIYEANLKEEGNNYVYTTQIVSDSSSAAEKKKMTVIMKLKEGTDFVMSFSIENAE